MTQKKKPAAGGERGQDRAPAGMALLFFVYSNAVDEEITEIVKRYAGGYTKFSGVCGEGSREPHLGSHIWPSMNNCIMVAVASAQKAAMTGEILSLKEKFPGLGITVFVTRLDEML